MKKKIDEWIESKKKDFIDYEKYFNDNIIINPSTAKYFDEFLDNFPLNYINAKDGIKILDNSRLTYKERQELINYLSDRVEHITNEEYEKKDIIIDKLDKIFDDYLFNSFKYCGKNKRNIFNYITCLLDYTEDYEDIYKQFNEVSNIVLNIINEVK